MHLVGAHLELSRLIVQFASDAQFTVDPIRKAYENKMDKPLKANLSSKTTIKRRSPNEQ